MIIQQIEKLFGRNPESCCVCDQLVHEQLQPCRVKTEIFIKKIQSHCDQTNLEKLSVSLPKSMDSY